MARTTKTIENSPQSPDLSMISEPIRTLARPIGEIKPDPRNARKHLSQSIEVIKASLTSFGQQKPIVVDPDGFVVAGNGTLQAASELGWTHIAVVESNLTGAKRAAFALADNRSAELSEWDRDAVAGLIAEIDAPQSDPLANMLQELDTNVVHGFIATTAEITSIKPHPRNYRQHPEDQLAHIVESIRAYGIYRNVVVSSDSFIVAGHGVVEAAKRLGKTTLPIYRLTIPHDDPRSLKLLTGDNEISNLSMDDDRALTEILKDVMGKAGLLGTGFDQQQLAALVMTSRHSHEIADKDHAAEWLGLPEFEAVNESKAAIIIKCETPEHRDELVAKLGMKPTKKQSKVWSFWYPERDRQDLASVEFKPDSEQGARSNV